MVSIPEDFWKKSKKKPHKEETEGQLCLDTSTYSQESGDLPSLEKNSDELKPNNLSRSTPTHKPFCDRTSQLSLFTGISETITPSSGNSTLLPADSPALAHLTRDFEKGYYTPNQPSGEKESDALSNADRDFSLSNNLQELSIGDLERFLEPCEWSEILSSLKSSRRRSAGLATDESDYLLFPTLTANKGDTNRPAGVTRCESFFKGSNLITDGLQLNAEAMALIMGFPAGWFAALKTENSRVPNTPHQPTPQDELEADTSLAAPSPQDKPRSLSNESSISTVSETLLGDNLISTSISPSKCFTCQYSQRISSSKLFTCLTDGHYFTEITAKECDRYSPKGELEAITPTKRPRRRRGQGSGYLLNRLSQGKYEQLYYQIEFGGKKRSIYIASINEEKIRSLDLQGRPIKEILQAIDSPKAREVAEEYRLYLKEKL